MITSVNQITKDLMLEIDALLNDCKEHDGNSIPIYKHLIERKHPIACNLLYYKDNKLIGYLRSFFFYADTCEMSVMVSPNFRRQKIATQLLSQIIPILENEGIKKLVFSTPAKINNSWLESLGLAHRNSEYHMQYFSNLKTNITIPKASIRYAKFDDIESLCNIDEQSFPNKKVDKDTLFQGLFKTPNCDLFALVHDGKVIGKAHSFTESDKVRLTDIGILSEYRSQGFGRAIIKHCINHALLRNKTNIALDVETLNTKAIKLYEQMGFKAINSHDYFQTTTPENHYGLAPILAKHHKKS
jgi:ribosomal protein S18 acetylase RimI-like enzyme